MIAKGLDYPNITLVGVLNADTMLNLPDFRRVKERISYLHKFQVVLVVMKNLVKLLFKHIIQLIMQ